MQYYAIKKGKIKIFDPLINIIASLSFFIKKNNLISTYDNQIDNHA